MPTYEGRKRVFPHAHLEQSARHLVELAESDEVGSYYTSMMSLVASAFMLEALLNYLGPKLITSWSWVDRTSARGKLELICERLRLTPDFGVAPYQSFVVLFQVRNALAHGRREEVAGRFPGGPGNPGVLEALEVPWEKVCKPEDAREHYDAARSIATELWDKAGEHDGPFTRLSTGTAVGPR